MRGIQKWSRFSPAFASNPGLDAEFESERKHSVILWFIHTHLLNAYYTLDFYCVTRLWQIKYKRYMLGHSPFRKCGILSDKEICKCCRSVEQDRERIEWVLPLTEWWEKACRQEWRSVPRRKACSVLQWTKKRITWNEISYCLIPPQAEIIVYGTEPGFYSKYVGKLLEDLKWDSYMIWLPVWLFDFFDFFLKK